MRIVSDRRVHRIERRIHSVPWKGEQELPLETFGIRNGIALRSAGYFAALWLVFYVVAHSPVGFTINWVNWEIRWFAIPGVLVYAAMTLRPNDVAPHVWVWAGLRHGQALVRERIDARRGRMRGKLKVTGWEAER